MLSFLHYSYGKGINEATDLVLVKMNGLIVEHQEGGISK